MVSFGKTCTYNRVKKIEVETDETRNQYKIKYEIEKRPQKRHNKTGVPLTGDAGFFLYYIVNMEIANLRKRVFHVDNTASVVYNKNRG